ncbi:MAG: hypothetical protein H7Y01_05765 [Ferruginibacter sp.]|nr:hypothetical protein [Chitinophagaceae bacterium]
MKRIKILLSASMLLLCSVVFGQAEKNVSAIKTGTVLTDTDIGFLSLVSNASLDESRGAAGQTVSIGGTSYKAGQTLTATQARSVNKAIKTFQKSYKAPDASRGAGLCYYWYYYCDGYGYCSWYKYWYYC